VLEEYEHAVKRGAKIYCEVVGGGMSADAHHMTAPHPEGAGAILSMEEALSDAHLAPSAVDYINVHGTSTPLGDIAELKALETLFGDDLKRVSISSTKSMTGHLLGAAAAIEALACIMAITRGIIPPTINVENLDPAINPELDLTLGAARKREVNVALSNTFGFGGHNSTVIFRRIAE
jgi:3-oxoacyl-[acyl-carrier-protein] synthase II